MRCLRPAFQVGVKDWRNLVSLPEYGGHRKEEREKEIDKRMQKVAFHFLSIARVANQKHPDRAIQPGVTIPRVGSTQ